MKARASGLIVLATAVTLSAWVTPAMAQRGLGNPERLFLLYNQVNNQRAQRQLATQQQQLAQQVRQYGPGGTGRPGYAIDPVEAYIRGVEAGMPTSTGRPGTAYGIGSYGGPTGGAPPYRRQSSFQQQSRFFNPQRSPGF